MKHITARVAWHDNKWNGKICKDPSDNVYCIDNQSLLSSRINRRRCLDIEEKYAGKNISEATKDKYIPPCYWCINIQGDKECNIEDKHPFCDTWNKFNDNVPPIKDILKPHSSFSWNFDLSFKTTGVYKYPVDLEDRVNYYLNQLEPSESIVFFYANYSNPITSDERKFLLLGAGVVLNKIDFPKKYDFPKAFYDEINKDMPVFPKMAWQFQLPLNPKSLFILPYHEYLSKIDSSSGKEQERYEKYLDEVAVRIDDSTIIPHFKYVSMQLSSDKAIYLLYQIKKSLKQIKSHGIISIEDIQLLEKKTDLLLNLAWKKRGRCPGFKNLIKNFLKND